MIYNAGALVTAKSKVLPPYLYVGYKYLSVSRIVYTNYNF